MEGFKRMTNNAEKIAHHQRELDKLFGNLEFDDDLRMAVVWLTCKKVYDDFFTEDSINESVKAEKEYEQEMRKNEPQDPVISKIRKV